MKASEIFMQFAEPIASAVPATGEVEQLQTILSVPALVWNAVVLDRNLQRKKGQMPKVLLQGLPKLKGDEKTMTDAMLRFWVDRKDKLFADHDWPIEITVYKNVKQELIVRAQVPIPKHFVPNLPKEWSSRMPNGTVTSLNPK